MPTYAVIHSPLKQGGEIIQIGGTIELSENDAKGLEQFLELAAEQSKEKAAPLNVNQTIELVKAAETPEALKQLLDDENALPSPRKGVLDAITKRTGELEQK